MVTAEIAVKLLMQTQFLSKQITWYPGFLRSGFYSEVYGNVIALNKMAKG